MRFLKLLKPYYVFNIIISTASDSIKAFGGNMVVVMLVCGGVDKKHF